MNIRLTLDLISTYISRSLDKYLPSYSSFLQSPRPRKKLFSCIEQRSAGSRTGTWRSLHGMGLSISFCKFLLCSFTSVHPLQCHSPSEFLLEHPSKDNSSLNSCFEPDTPFRSPFKMVVHSTVHPRSPWHSLVTRFCALLCLVSFSAYENCMTATSVETGEGSTLDSVCSGDDILTLTPPRIQ